MVSLTLTEEQAKTLGADPWRQTFLNGDFIEGARGINCQGQPLIVKFAFEPVSPARMLKPVEVSQMLRIGRSFLAVLVKERRLKSYKIGRFRRFMLADVLAYLEKQKCEESYVRPEALLSAQSCHTQV